MAGDGRSLSRSERVYRALLKAYPREFREEYGAHMAQAFGDSWRQEVGLAGSGGLAALWVRTLADLLVSASAERGRTVVPFLSSSGMIRFGGVAAMVGGTLGALLMLRSLTMWYWRSPGDPAWLFEALDLVGVVATLLIAIGTLGLYACVAIGPRKLATVGLVVASLSAVMIAGAILYESLVGLTYGSAEGTDVSPGTLSVAFAVVSLIETAGFVLLGLALLITRALGRWSALPLVLGLFPLVAHYLFLLLFTGPGGTLAGPQMLWFVLSNLPDLLVNLGWVFLGYLLWSRWSKGAEDPAQPARTYPVARTIYFSLVCVCIRRGAPT